MKHYILLIGVISVFFTNSAIADVGARPLSMGGAFVAVVDDIHACYWNPAALAEIKSWEATSMYTINNRETRDVSQWGAAGIRLDQYGGLAISYMDTRDWTGVATSKGEYVLEGRWVGVSWGGFGNERFKDTSFGVIVNQCSTDLKDGSPPEIGKSADITDTSYSETYQIIDVGLLQRIGPDLRVGILLQNANEPKIKFENGVIFSKKINICTGIAWRIEEKTQISLDIHGLTEKDWYAEDAKQSQIRIGLEHWITPLFAIRAGFAGGDYLSIGLGYKSEIGAKTLPQLRGQKVETREQMYKFLEVDYGLISDVINDEVTTTTHLLSLTVKF